MLALSFYTNTTMIDVAGATRLCATAAITAIARS
jgi:hypothetical protein